MGVRLLDRMLEQRYRDLVGRGRHFFLLARPPIRSPPGFKTGKGTTRSLHKFLPFMHITLMLAADLALYYGESINLTWHGEY